MANAVAGRAPKAKVRQAAISIDPLKADVGGRAEDWETGRCLSTSQILANLKLYGRLAGIEEGKLTLMALRRTATRLRLDEGASLEEMQVFLDSHEGARAARYRLGRLPELPALHAAVLLAYGLVGYRAGLALTRRRLLR